MTQGKQERIYGLQSATAEGKGPFPAGMITVPIRSIAPRHNDTRHINASHAVDLAESIAVLGLLEPIGIDTNGHLLIGGHRLAALQLLVEPDPVSRRKAFLIQCGRPEDEETPPEDLKKLAERVEKLGEDPIAESPLKDGVPVQVLDVSGKNGDGLALAVEAAENNLRRPYTAKEIKVLAARFEKLGYKSTVGNPKAGEKTKLNMLAAAVGKSKRQIQRIISGVPSAGSKKSAWEKSKESFRKAAAKVLQAGEKKGKGKAGLSDDDKELVSVATKVGKLLAG